MGICLFAPRVLNFRRAQLWEGPGVKEPFGGCLDARGSQFFAGLAELLCKLATPRLIPHIHPNPLPEGLVITHIFRMSV